MAAKSGVEPSECLELARHVKRECPNLRFSGLMTIGMPDYTSTPENFKVLDCTYVLLLGDHVSVLAEPFFQVLLNLRSCLE